MIIKLLKFVFGPIIFLYAYVYFLVNKKNLRNSHTSFINMYCLTKGLSIFILNFLIAFNYQIRKIFNQNLNKKKLATSNKNLDLHKTLKEIKKIGYSINPEYLDQNTVDEILNLEKTLPCSYINRDEIKKTSNIRNIPVDTTIVDLNEEDLLQNKVIKDLVHNQIFYDIAEKYFSSTPILTNVGFRISKISSKPGNREAQLYHFDLDRPKWLKFFIYLNDVENISHGPHSFIEKTHKLFSKPYKILIKRYQRISDEEIFKFYNKKNEVFVYGKAGTLAIGDTLAFHKGNNPTTKERKVLTIEFSNSLFGTNFKYYNLSKNSFKDSSLNFDDKFYDKFI